MIIVLLFVVLVPATLCHETQRINATFDKVYNGTVSTQTDYIFRFDFVVEPNKTQAVRVVTKSVHASTTYPVLVVVRQQREIMSWRLPLNLEEDAKTYSYTEVARTLCPTTIDLNAEASNQTFSVAFSSQTSNLTFFTIIVSLVPKFQIEVNDNRTFLVSPSQPQYFLFRYPGDLSSVNVKVKSETSQCMRVSIQSASCPVYDFIRNSQFTGIWQTASTRAAVTVPKHLFKMNDAFFVVVVVYSEDHPCNEKANDPIPDGDVFPDDVSIFNREKHVSVIVRTSLAIDQYFLPVFGTVVFLMLFYVGAFVIALIYHAYEVKENLKKRGKEAFPKQVHDTEPFPNIPESQEQEQENANNEDPQSLPGTSAQAVSESTVPKSNSDDHGVVQFAAENHYPETMERNHQSYKHQQSETSTRVSDFLTYSTSDGFLPSSESTAVCSHGFVDLYNESQYDKNVVLLQPHIRVHDLARKPPSRLRKKYSLYYYYLIIISIFYALPVIQLVLTYQKVLNNSGDQDLCYYNFDCAHPLGVISSFNNVYSNIAYVLLGFLFLILSWRRDLLHQNLIRKNPIAAQYGIPHHYGLFYAIAIALIMEGVLSGCYHICPSFNNFQFDTAYMYMLSGLCLLKIYQTRHPDVNASAHMAYLAMAIVIFIGLLGVFYSKESSTFYILFCILVILVSVLLTFEVYYLGRWKMNAGRVKQFYILLRTEGRSCFRPQRPDRLILLVVANCINWSLAIYGAVKQFEDFSSFMLLILMVNMSMYFIFYIIMKYKHGERLKFTAIGFLAVDVLAWAASLYFFLHGATNWTDSAATSRTKNQPCLLLDFYDRHDVWHFMSAIAMFFGFMVLLTMDDDLEYVKRDTIHVF